MKLLVATVLLALALPLGAQSPEPVLKGKEVTTEALIDALALPDANTPRTRGLKPVAAGTKPVAGTAAGAGKANLQITFLTGSTQLTAEAEEIVAKLAQAMKSEQLATQRFRVEGHADARGDPAANLALSKSRAEAVAAQLSGKHGIPAERLEPEGRGSAEPLNKARVDAPENRRVTVVSLR
jgi:OmpA-OmpF porin, OOP family